MIEAKLSLYSLNSNAGSEKLSVFVLKTEWHEMEATWSKASKNESWQQDVHDSLQGGGDTTTKVTTTPYGPENSWEHYTITETFRKFLGGSPNNGFVIVPDDRTGWCETTAREYVSSENKAQKKFRPKITIKTTNTAIPDNTIKLKGSNNIAYNLTKDYLNVTIPYSNYSLIVTNIEGKRLYSNRSNDKKLKISANELSQGLNVLNIKYDNGNKVLKFLYLQ